MRGLFRLAACLLGLLSSVVAKSSTGNSVLVVVDPENRDLYTTFFSGLKSQGYQLTFRAPKDEAPLIIQDDYPTFAHIVYFAPDTKSASYCVRSTARLLTTFPQHPQRTSPPKRSLSW